MSYWPIESEQSDSGWIDTFEVGELLASLTEKSLVVMDEQTGRYSLLETLRDYARIILSSTDEAGRIRDRHLGHFEVLAIVAESHLVGAEQREWLETLDADHDNLRAALDYSSEHNPECGLRLAGAVWRFWYIRGDLAEGRERLSRVLACEASGPPAARAKALNGSGALAFDQGDYASSAALQEESLRVFRGIGHRQGIAMALHNLASVAYAQGEYSAAGALYDECLSIRREIDDRWGIATTLFNLSLVASAQGDNETASARCDECLQKYREIGNQRGIAHALDHLGLLAFRRGDLQTAQQMQEECLEIFQALGDRRGISTTLEGLADITAALGNLLTGARLWGAAARLRETIGAPLTPNELRQQELQVSAARAALNDDTAFDAAWLEGRAMTLERAIELAPVADRNRAP